MEAIRPAEWRLYRCGRHHLCRQFRIQHDAESGLQARSADRQCKGRQGRRAHPGSGAGEGGHWTGNRQRRGRGSRRCRWECLRRGSRCAQADAIRKEVTSSRVPCWGERPAGLNITRLRRRRACCLNRRQGAADLSRLVWAHLRGAQSVRELPKIRCCLRTCHAEARVLPQLRSSLTRG